MASASSLIRYLGALVVFTSLAIAQTPSPALVITVRTARQFDVRVIDAVTRHEIKRIRSVGKDPHAILITPDGSCAYVANERANDVVIIDLKSLEITGSIITGDQPEKMAWVERK